MTVVDDALNIYTDGSSRQSPRVGGIGVRFVFADSSGDEQVVDLQAPGYRNATNNEMELQACIVGLKEAMTLKEAQGLPKIVIHTDSLYIADNYRAAMFTWPRTKWRTRDGTPVLNAPLWKKLVRQIKHTPRRVEFRWVRGHAKDEHNKAADKLAKLSARNPLNKPLSLVHVRRKITSKSVDRGSVKMLGQRMSIHVITTKYLEVHKLWKCKYEVISKTSPFRGNVDIIFSEPLLKAGHSYFVQVNRNSANPSIVKVFREIQPRAM